MCARRATDRDLASKRCEKVNAWKSTRQATDHDLESSSTMKRENFWICASLTTDHDPASVIPDEKRKSVIFLILRGLIVFGIDNRRNSLSFNFFNLRTNFACNHFRRDGLPLDVRRLGLCRCQPLSH